MRIGKYCFLFKCYANRKFRRMLNWENWPTEISNKSRSQCCNSHLEQKWMLADALRWKVWKSRQLSNSSSLFSFARYSGICSFVEAVCDLKNMNSFFRIYRSFIEKADSVPGTVIHAVNTSYKYFISRSQPRQWDKLRPPKNASGYIKSAHLSRFIF